MAPRTRGDPSRQRRSREETPSTDEDDRHQEEDLAAEAPPDDSGPGQDIRDGSALSDEELQKRVATAIAERRRLQLLRLQQLEAENAELARSSTSTDTLEGEAEQQATLNRPHKRGPSATDYAPIPKRPIREPRVYKGVSIKEHQEFKVTCELAFLQAPALFSDGLQQVTWAMQYIEGDPRERWMHWWIENAEERPAVTWEQFCTFLLNLLDDPLARLLDAHEKYSEAKQRESQTARVFLTYLESLENQMEPYTPLQKL